MGINSYTIQDLRKILNNTVKDYDAKFGNPDKCIDSIYNWEGAYGYYSLINQCRIYLKSKVLIFVTMDGVSVIPFDKIIGYEVVNLKDNSAPMYSATTTTTTTSSGDILKRAIIGGALAGGVGAVIGGATAKTTTRENPNFFDYLKYIPDLELRISIDDILSPLLKIPFEGFKDNAEEVASSLNVIIKRNADIQDKEETKLIINSIKFIDVGNSMGTPPCDPYKTQDEIEKEQKEVELVLKGDPLSEILGYIILICIVIFVIALFSRC